MQQFPQDSYREVMQATSGLAYNHVHALTHTHANAHTHLNPESSALARIVLHDLQTGG